MYDVDSMKLRLQVSFQCSCSSSWSIERGYETVAQETRPNVLVLLNVCRLPFLIISVAAGCSMTSKLRFSCHSALKALKQLKT